MTTGGAGGLELDHVFCMVRADGDWAQRLAAAGWALDEGSVHGGQGTRNRRLIWLGHFLELVWVEDPTEARANPLRLDRRADWRTTGASPFGIGLRGDLDDTRAADFWRYDALGFPIWIHHDNERSPERPLVFVLARPSGARAPTGPTRAAGTSARSGATRTAGMSARPVNPGRLHAVTIHTPAPGAPPAWGGPAVRWTAGEPRMELVATAGRPVAVTDLLSIDVRPDPLTRR